MRAGKGTLSGALDVVPCLITRFFHFLMKGINPAFLFGISTGE